MMPKVQTSPAPSVSPASSGGARSSLRAKLQDHRDHAASFGDLLSDASGSGTSHTGPAETETGRTTKKASRDPEEKTAATGSDAPAPQSTAMPTPVSLHQLALNRPSEEIAKEKEAMSANEPESSQTEIPMGAAPAVKVPTIRPHGPPVMTPGQEPEAPSLKPPSGLIDPHGPPDQPDIAPPAGDPTDTAPGIPTKLPPIIDDQGEAAPAVPTKLPPIVEPGFPVSPNTQKSAVTGTVDPTPKTPLPGIEPHGPPTMPPDEVTAPGMPGGSMTWDDTTKKNRLGLPDNTSQMPTKLPPVGITDAKATMVALPSDPVTDRAFPDPNPPVGGTGGDVPLAGDPGTRVNKAGTPLSNDSAMRATTTALPTTLPVEMTTALQAQGPASNALPPEVFSSQQIAALPTGVAATPPLATPTGDPTRITAMDRTTVFPTQSIAPPTSAAADTAASNPANIADRRVPGESRSVNTPRQKLQTTDYEQLNYAQPLNGTSIAKEDADMTASLSEPTIDRSDLLRRGNGIATGRPTLPGAEKLVAGLPIFQADAPAQNNHIAQTTPVAPANAMVMADRVEHILQTVLDAGIKAGTQTENQMDLRVHLDGGANDVTVRIQMNESRMHVTFQTDSTGLRQALEHGWSDFTAHAARSAAVTVEPPGFTGHSQGQTPTANDFSQRQQNPSQQDSRRTFDGDAPTFGSAPRTESALTTTARPATPPVQGAATRWAGWA